MTAKRMKNLKIEATGLHTSDLEQAVEEALSRIRAGNLSGLDSNDTGSFTFAITDDYGDHEIVEVAAKDVKEGDLVDLEGDTYADPDRDHPAFESEFQTVMEVEHETPECVAIGFDGFDVVGFPVDHVLKVKRPE